MTSTLDAALGYARRGWRVFPLRPRLKTPLIKAWQTQATTNAEQIAKWWETWPTANVAIATGAESNLLVLDLDRKGDADGVAVATAVWNWEQPEVCQQTGGGGLQAFYAWPNGSVLRNRAALAGHKGIDVRADGGYVVAPPSTHPDGPQYEWLGNPNEPLDLPPAWLLAACTDAEKPARNPSHAATVSEPAAAISEGARNSTLASLAGTMRRRGMSEPAIEAALLAENERRCSPPLDQAEVRQIAASVARYQPDPTATDAEKIDIEVKADAAPPFAKFEALTANDRKFTATWGRNRSDFSRQEQYDASLSALAAAAGWQPQEIADLVAAHRAKGAQPPLDVGALARVVAGALRFTRQQRAMLDLTASGEEATATQPGSAPDKPAVMAKLADALGIKARRWLQHGREHARYVLELADGRQVLIGPTEAVLSVNRFKARVYEATGLVLPSVKQVVWDQVAKTLASVAEILENEETSTAWQGAAWVESYLEQQGTPRAEGDWKERFALGQPFIKDGALFLRAAAVGQHLRMSGGPRLSHEDLCEALRQAGFKRETVGARIDGKSVSRSLWKCAAGPDVHGNMREVAEAKNELLQ